MILSKRGGGGGVGGGDERDVYNEIVILSRSSLQVNEYTFYFILIDCRAVGGNADAEIKNPGLSKVPPFKPGVGI